MKRILVLFSALLIFITAGASPAPAKGAGVTIDVALSVADETYKGSDAALGFGFGVSYDLGDTVRLGDGRLIGRADMNFYQGSSDYLYLDVDSSRIPFFFGARYVLPVRTQPLDLFAEAGIELSFDEYEQLIPIGGLFLKSTVSDTNLGVSPGFGARLPLSDNLSLGANARLHLISNSYLSFTFSLGYTF